MTDNTASGAPEAQTAPAAATAGADTAPAAFGSTRGSGLSRGKRTSAIQAAKAPSAPADYKPTSVQVITPHHEYTNPFAPAASADALATPAPTEVAPVAAVAPQETPAPAPAPVAEVSQPVAAPVEDTPAAKAEINILPPAETSRQPVSWESRPGDSSRGDDRGRRHERPTFRPSRDGDRGPDGQGRQDSFKRPREERPYANRPEQAPTAEQPKKGFFGWLKGLFGGSKTQEPAQGGEPSGDPHRGGHRHRRRHRGGRGNGGHSGAPGDRRQGGERHSSGGDFQNRGEHGGNRRRRHRGGRGRGRGGEPRMEGHQGGGAI
jgi:hypothetical protein